MNTSQTSQFVTLLTNSLSLSLQLSEIRGSRGGGYRSTQYYQIRVKPQNPKLSVADLLTSIHIHLTEYPQISNICVNSKSPNSSKYSSISFVVAGKCFDVVVARGQNKGEAFEKQLLNKMQSVLSYGDVDTLAQSAFDALAKSDADLVFENIQCVRARTGKTHRSSVSSPSESGAIIADIVIQVKNGKEKYVSVKNSNGTTIANFGIAKAFNDDLTINRNSLEYAAWIKPFELDEDAITAGLLAARDKNDIPYEDTHSICVPLTSESEVYKLMEKMWGSDYIYLREHNNGFKALNITKQYIDEHLLKNLVMTQIRYPFKSRKQISIYLNSDSSKFKIEIRNTSGKLKPAQINLSMM